MSGINNKWVTFEFHYWSRRTIANAEDWRTLLLERADSALSGKLSPITAEAELLKAFQRSHHLVPSFYGTTPPSKLSGISTRLHDFFADNGMTALYGPQVDSSLQLRW